MSNFDYTLSIGKKVENYVKRYFENRGHQLEDLSDVKEWQEKDVDFNFKFKDGKEALFEVKADSKLGNTGNLFFEVGFDRVTGYYAGWFSKTAAALICFVDYVNKKGYIVLLDKDVIKENSRNITWQNRTDCCLGFAYLLPITKAKELGLVVYEWTIEEDILKAAA